MSLLFLIAPVLGYMIVYSFTLQPHVIARYLGGNLRPLKRQANGCTRKTCIDYPPNVDGIECEVNKEHWRVHKGTRKSCSDSRAVISKDEVILYKLVYSKRNETLRHLLAIAALLVTIIIAILNTGK